jgi:hypothetical protein
MLRLIADRTDQPATELDKTMLVKTSSVLITEQPGDRIARYKLLQKIGEGGCGVVSMAEQVEPVRRVALKLVKPGNSSQTHNINKSQP